MGLRVGTFWAAAFLSCGAAAASAQTPVYVPCITEPSDASVALELFLAAQWTLPTESELEIALAVVGRHMYSVANFPRAPRDLAELEERLSWADDYARRALDISAILVRENEALYFKSDHLDRISDCFIAGSDLRDVTFDQDDAQNWTTTSGAQGAFNFIWTDLPNPSGVATTFFIQGRSFQEFEVTYPTLGDEFIYVSFLWN